ncbi:MAG: hypothetical protein K8U57_36135 [Planctomycetes bacterium]|nr:hypothetical protein [Planctomycetota bacterium]
MKRYTAEYWFMNWDDKDCNQLNTDSLQEAIDFVTHIPSAICTHAFGKSIYDTTLPIEGRKNQYADIWNGDTPTHTEAKRSVAEFCAALQSASNSIQVQTARSVEQYKEMIGMLRSVPTNPETPGFGGDNEA